MKSVPMAKPVVATTGFERRRVPGRPATATRRAGPRGGQTGGPNRPDGGRASAGRRGGHDRRQRAVPTDPPGDGRGGVGRGVTTAGEWEPLSRLRHAFSSSPGRVLRAVSIQSLQSLQSVLPIASSVPIVRDRRTTATVRSTAEPRGRRGRREPTEGRSTARFGPGGPLSRTGVCARTRSRRSGRCR